MLFNSIDFAIFLPIVFVLYWFVCQRNLKLQNVLLFVVSYVFYGWWDWRFLSLILFSTIVDFSIAKYLHQQDKARTRILLLSASLFINLGFLAYFKYYNFFLSNFVEAFTWFGGHISPRTLSIVLPVGISFYTFQTLSYTIDVYRRKLEPTKDFISFAAFVSFFPQLVAGPIERASNLLPQFYSKRKFDYALAVNGSKQILWGLFKKMVIADNCAVIVNEVYNNNDAYGSASLLIATIFFAFQIYGDFSGYSDIAIGVSRLFGFDLKKNFAFPYFSRDIAEFWRRWHISLSTWFRDYLYIPLGGSKGGMPLKIRNTFIIFLVSGFWHGANWTFVVWGALNACYFLPLLLRNKNRVYTNEIALGRVLPKGSEFLKILFTFFITCLAWVFFRAENVGHALQILADMFSFSVQKLDTSLLIKSRLIVLLLLAFIVVEWGGRNRAFAIEKYFFNKRYLNWLFFIGIVLTLGLFSRTEETPFIYFQF